MLVPGVRAHDYGKETPESLFRRIAEDGWQTVQLAFKKAIVGAELPEIPPALIEETRAALDRHALTVGVLGAYVEPSLTTEALRLREEAVFCAQIPVAAQLGAGCIGTETTNMEKQPGVSRKEALRSLRRSLEGMLQKAEDYGVTVAVEPVYYHAMSTPEETREILSDMQSPHLKVIFDPVNLLSPDRAARQHELWERCFDCFGERIAAIHIKGVRQEGERMISCTLEESAVDYPALFEKLRSLPGSIPLLREEARPALAVQDLTLFRQLSNPK